MGIINKFTDYFDIILIEDINYVKYSFTSKPKLGLYKIELNECGSWFGKTLDDDK